MSDKFVVSTNEIGEIIVTDVETGKVYDNIYKFFGLIRLLNELSDENGQLRKQVAEYDMILRQHEFAEKEGLILNTEVEM